jgi:hypothetical protein
MRIVVNADEFDVKTEFISYEDVALLAGRPPGDASLTVVYTTPPVEGRGRSGTLIPGRSIDIEPGMTFDAVNTSDA